jgi:hypothetical protein
VFAMTCVLVASISWSGVAAAGTCRVTNSGPVPLTVANPTNSHIDPACGLVSRREASTVLGVKVEELRGAPPSGPTRESTCDYSTTAPAPTEFASVRLYPSVPSSAFPSEEFEPVRACAWTSATVQVGDKAVAGDLLNTAYVSFWKDGKVVQVLFHDPLPSGAQPVKNRGLAEAVTLAKLAGARI